METILLIIIGILIISDLCFLYKIYRNTKDGKEVAADEKYFELKYNINLLKSIAAILIFVLGYLGYSTYKDFSDKVNKNFDEKIELQNKKHQEISGKTDRLRSSVDSLEILKNSLEVLIDSYESKLKILNDKILLINNSLKYNPRIYVVKNLKFHDSNFYINNPLKIYFKDLTSIFGEKLPNFTKPPLINVQGYSITIDVLDVTTEYVIFASGSTTDYTPNNKSDDEYYKFDIWMASFD